MVSRQEAEKQYQEAVQPFWDRYNSISEGARVTHEAIVAASHLRRQETVAMAEAVLDEQIKPFREEYEKATGGGDTDGN